jgi:hypothetical protein
VLTLDPCEIRLHTNFQSGDAYRELRNRVFGADVLPGAVLDGDWDIECEPFEDLEVYKAIRDRILYGTPWRETGYFAESIRDIEGGRPLWNCHDAAQLDRRLTYVDSLIESIRTHGLLLQRDVGPAQDPSGRYSDELEVNVGRDGKFLFQDGRHRLCVVKALGLPAVTVKVRARHVLWQQVREAMLDLAGRDEGRRQRLPHPPPHPDLDDIRSYPGAEAALAGVARLLGAPGKRILDLHGRLCFFSHGLECLGHEVTAIETDTQWRALAARLRAARECRFALLASAEPLLAGTTQNSFDLGLLLSGVPGWPTLDGHDAELRMVLASGLVQTWCVGVASSLGCLGSDDLLAALPAELTQAVLAGELAAPQLLDRLADGFAIVTLGRSGVPVRRDKHAH